MITLKSAHEIELMRRAGKITAAARALAREMVKPGVTTHQIDKAVFDFIRSHGATPSFLHYNGYPASVCVSVNDEIIHGIPGKRVLKEGDIVSVDVGAFIGGFHGDCAGTYPCGQVSDEALREAVARHNRLCRVVTAIGDFRKLENPPITGYEYHVMMLVSQVCPHDLILPYLEDTLAELQTRHPEPVFPFRARVALAGSEIDDPEFTKLIELCGAMVVADRYCFGGFPGREEIVIREGETAFDAICRHYLHWNQCVRFMDGGKINQRHQELRRLVREYRADGVIYESMKFCEFWSYEKVLASHVLQQEMGIPCCTIEKEYNLGSVGQLRTRFQAFVESLEIKKIGAEKEGKL